jgi:hypothetical protein
MGSSKYCVCTLVVLVMFLVDSRIRSLNTFVHTLSILEYSSSMLAEKETSKWLANAQGTVSRTRRLFVSKDSDERWRKCGRNISWEMKGVREHVSL